MDTEELSHDNPEVPIRRYPLDVTFGCAEITPGLRSYVDQGIHSGLPPVTIKEGESVSAELRDRLNSKYKLYKNNFDGDNHVSNTFYGKLRKPKPVTLIDKRF